MNSTELNINLKALKKVSWSNVLVYSLISSPSPLLSGWPLHNLHRGALWPGGPIQVQWGQGRLGEDRGGGDTVRVPAGGGPSGTALIITRKVGAENDCVPLVRLHHHEQTQHGQPGGACHEGPRLPVTVPFPTVQEPCKRDIWDLVLRKGKLLLVYFTMVLVYPSFVLL